MIPNPNRRRWHNNGPIEVPPNGVPLIGGQKQPAGIRGVLNQIAAPLATPRTIDLPAGIDEEGNQLVALHTFGGLSDRLELVKAMLTGCCNNAANVPADPASDSMMLARAFTLAELAISMDAAAKPHVPPRWEPPATVNPINEQAPTQ